MIRFDDWKDFCYVIGQGFFVYAILGALLPVNKYFVLGYAGIQVLGAFTIVTGKPCPIRSKNLSSHQNVSCRS